ncbi:MAG: hypothetical protein CMM61_02655 [Rhodospirillaceae bacterium]|nr:hypothetical protein [Rhodospirillaceae bacterium]
MDQSDTLRDKLAALASSYIAQVPDAMALLEGHVNTIAGGDGGREAILELRSGAHKLAGSSGTFGLQKVSRAAKVLETECDRVVEGFHDPSHEPTDGVPMTPGQVEQIIETYSKLKDAVALDTAAAEESGAPGVGLMWQESDLSQRRLVRIASDDTGERDRLASALRQHGFDVDGVYSGGAADDDALAVLADLASNEADAMPELGPGEAADGPPLIFFGADAGMVTRLEAVRKGGAAFLPSPVDILGLLQVLMRYSEIDTHEPSRVMIVDDDVVAGHYTQAVLEKAGMVVHLVDDVMNLLDALDAFVPDLFLLDLHMPGGTGVEMARVIRQDDRYAGIPMLFLSGEEETNRQAEALVAGAAGFVQKPARGSVLVPLARAMTRRSRRLRGVASRDPVSGLFNHSYVKMQLGREIDRARREQGRLTYVVFAIDHFSALNAMHGYAVGDTVLRYLAATVTARTRRTDACGRLDGGRFGLVLPNAAPAQAESLLRDIRATLADFEVREGEGAGGLTISCGLADFPTFDAPRGMSQAAEAALQAAREGGGDRVIRGK